MMSERLVELIGASQSCDERPAVTRRMRQRRADNVEVKRAAHPEMFVHMGELSSARQAWVGEVVAPGNQATDNQVTDDTRRPARPRDPLPDEILNFQPTVSLDLDEDRFCWNLQSSRRGAAAVLSGMTTEQLRPLFLVAKAQIPDIATHMIRVGRFTVLSKLFGECEGSWQATSSDVWWRARWRSSCRKQWRWQLRFFSTRCPPKQGVSAWPTLSQV